jgi:hypothetical protein
MYSSSLNRLLAKAVVCGLLLQSCRSGLRAINEEPVVGQECPTAGDHARASGEVLSSGTLASLHTDACVSSILASVSLGESTAAVPASDASSILESSAARAGVTSVPQSVVESFTASSPSTPYAYVGKLGLSGGASTRRVQSPAEEWCVGPAMMLHSNATSKAVYRIPSGYRYRGYRLTSDSVIRRARLTIYYIAANNKEEYRRLAAAQNAHTVAEKLGTDVEQVVSLGTLEGGVSNSHDYHEGCLLQRTRHAGLVLYGSTRKDKLLREKSEINIQVEVLLEKVAEASPVYGGQIAKMRRECVAVLRKQAIVLEETDTKPAARSVAQVATCSSVGCLAALRASPFSAPAPVFGAREWARYFGEVGEEPCLPSNVDEILESPCPFWPEQAVKDTHLLVLIPSTVSGKAFTLDLLGELIQSPRRGSQRTRYFLYDDEVQRLSGDVYSSSSYWILLTRDVLPGSRSRPYTAQQALVTAQTSHIDNAPYEIPHVLEVATAVLSYYVRSGHRLYEGVEIGNGLPSTSTRCAELLADSAGHPSLVTVGRFCSRGLVFLSGFDDDVEFGVSCLRRFGTRRYRPSALLHSFGPEEWSRYFGEVESAPPLPAHIVDTLNSACPFWPGKAVKDTHLLVLIPATVAGKPFSLDLLEELVQCPDGGGYPTRYRYYCDSVRRALGTRSPAKSYWVLMTREVLSGSRNATYTAQQALIVERAGETGLSYELPSALEAATVVLSHYVHSGERLYTDDPWTYTQCQELQEGDFLLADPDDEGIEHPLNIWYLVVVGGFSSGGLFVTHLNNYYYYYGSGVASLRKF